MKHRTRRLHVFHSLILASSLLAELHDRSDVVGRHHNLCFYQRLFHIINLGRVRQIRRVGQVNDGSVGFVNLIDNARCGRHEIQIVLTLQALLNNFQVKQSKETAAEAKAQRGTGLKFKGQGSVVQLQLSSASFRSGYLAPSAG